MHDFPCQRLCELINRHGTVLCEDAERCESLLHNVCGEEYQREVFVLIIAIKEGVTQELLAQPSGLPNDAVLNRLAQQLHDNLCLEKKSAQWAVQSWGTALGISIKKPIMVNEKSSQSLVSQTRQSAKVTPPKPLSHLNLLDYLRLFWWVLVMPQRLHAYRKTYGIDDEKQIGNWLVSTLIWFPLLIPSLALGLKQLPYSDHAWLPETYWLLSILLIGAWVLTGGLKINKDVPISVAGLVSVCMAVLVSVSVASIVVSLFSFLVALGVTTLVLVVIASIVMIVGAVLMSVLVASDAAIVIAGVVAIGMAVGIAGSVAILIADFMIGFIAASLAGFVAGLGVDVVANRMGNAIEQNLNRGIPYFLGSLIFLLLIIAYLFLIGLFIVLRNTIF